MQKIIIKNFRQISHAEIEVKDFLFLIGEQILKTGLFQFAI